MRNEELVDKKEAAHVVKRDKKMVSPAHKTRVKPFYVRGKQVFHKRKAKR